MEQQNVTNKHVALCSGNVNVQTKLLANLISQELELICDAYNNLDQVPDDTVLMLIDCHGQEIDTLIDTAKNIHNHASGASAALLNAEYGSAHEDLLDWPCISGLFYTDSEHDQLIRGLKTLLEGDYWVPRRLLHHFLDRNRKAPSTTQAESIKLTRREREILTLIKAGATNADIAETLSVSEHTIKSHLYKVYKKIGVRNRLEAANWVRQHSDW